MILFIILFSILSVGLSIENVENSTGIKIKIGHIGAINVMPKAEIILEICRKELFNKGILSDELDVE